MQLLLKILSHLQANVCTLLGIVFYLLSVRWVCRRDIRTYIFLRCQKFALGFHQNAHANH